MAARLTGNFQKRPLIKARKRQRPNNRTFSEDHMRVRADVGFPTHQYLEYAL